MKNERVLGIVFIMIMIPLSVLILLSVSPRPDLKSNPDRTVSLDSGWSYTDPKTNTLVYLDLPAVIKDIAPNEAVTVTRTLPDLELSDPVLFFKTEHQYVKIHINNRLIYEFTPHNKWFGHSPGSAIHFVELPRDFKNGTVEISVYSPYKAYSGVFEGISLGSRSTHLLNLLNQNFLTLLISLTICFLGIVLVIIFLIQLFSGVRFSEVLYLALFSLSSGIWMAAETPLVLLFIADPAFILNLSMISLYMMPIPLLMFISKSYRLKKRKSINLIVWAFILLNVLAALLQLIDAVDYHQFVPVFHIFCLLSILYVFVAAYREMRSGNKRIRTFMLGAVLFSLFNIGDMLVYNMSALSKGGLHFLSQAGILLFIFCAAASLGENLIKLRDIRIRNRILLSLAYTDTLTGLKNRTSFDEAEALINSRIGRTNSLSMIILDINNLKQINDTLGHKEGDRLIRDGAAILNNSLGPLGEVYRIGGDEFAIIIENSTEADINRAISELFEEIDSYNKKASSFKMSIAYGMATYKKETDKDLNSVFVRADKSMYSCKLNQKHIQVVD